MIYFYSKVKPDVLLHIVKKYADIEDGRRDLVPPEHFIQCSALKVNKCSFRSHSHIYKEGKSPVITQESWVVMNGRVKAILYDLDGEIVSWPELNRGDILITLNGGHGFDVLQDNTIVYEFKTGPYEGQEKDKVWI
jgi:hypothetical protein